LRGCDVPRISGGPDLLDPSGRIDEDLDLDRPLETAADRALGVREPLLDPLAKGPDVAFVLRRQAAVPSGERRPRGSGTESGLSGAGVASGSAPEAPA
jgi:hypothetical protein